MPDDDVISTHIKKLGLKSKEDYLKWCAKRGFKKSLSKGIKALKKEQTHYRDFIIQNSLTSSKTSSLERQIEEVLNPKGKYVVSNIFLLKLDKNQKEFNTEYCSLIKFLDKKTKILGIKTIQNSLYNLNNLIKLRSYWVRPLKKWKPKSHNPYRQYSALLRHLFAKYDVPLFMDASFSKPESSKEIKWFLHIAQGKNIRTAEGLPFPLTKKQAHLFLTAPNNYDIDSAFLWATVLALGGPPVLSDALLGTKLYRDKRDYKFKEEVIKFFINNPMLDRAHIQPIIDYIWYKKYEGLRIFREQGGLTWDTPPQPNFSLNGRTPEALLNQVNRWHRQLGKETKGQNLFWEHENNINDFKLSRGTEKNRRVWRIQQLLSSRELAVEGRAMNHCVSSYSHSCKRGSSSIWSLNSEDYISNCKKLVTIEVDPKGGRICQIRGKNNRLPSQIELEIIHRWAIKEGITTPSWIKAI